MKSTIAANKDLLELLDELTALAQANGDQWIPRTIESGLRAGLTTSEQLGGVRSALAQITLKLDARYPDEMRSRVDEAIGVIDRWFERVNSGRP